MLMTTRIKPARIFSDQLLGQYRQQGDPTADAVIASVVNEQGKEGLRSLMTWLADTQDFSTVNQSPVIQQFFTEHATLPNWADATRMARGMAFFSKHVGAISLILGCFSLPYCYLGADGAQVLWLTERIKNDTAQRLQETGEWLFAVNNPAEWRLNKAILRTLKVRLIHAGARWFTKQSGRWNDDWGIPINQEDMAGTNLAFSYVVLLGLRKMGVTVTDQEEEDYLHHINVVSSLNGLAEELIPENLRQAYQLGHAIARRQFQPSQAGTGLTRSLLDAITKQVGGDKPEATRNLVAGQMRFLLGDTYADLLDVPQAPLEKRLAGLLTRLPIFPSVAPVPGNRRG
jgi:hypothetical protein